MVRMNTEFELLADGLGAGRAPAGWAAIVDMPVLILVGVTGVGKSATVRALRSRWDDISLLPNRRKIADLLVIPTVQGWDGASPSAVTDRRRRFDYTRRYRQRHSGGLAHALTRLVLQHQPPARPGRPDPPSAARPSRPGAQRHNVDQGRGVTILSGSALHIFDGLRGADEVAFALKALPLARFAVLNAPDVVRVERLLQRQDAFDQVSRPARGSDQAPATPPTTSPRPQATAVSASGGRFRWDEETEGRDLFTQAEQNRLAELVNRGEVDRAELAAKIAIVAAERRNYDPRAAVEILRRQAPDRTVVVDTTTHSPDEVAAAIGELIQPGSAGVSPAYA